MKSPKNVNIHDGADITSFSNIFFPFRKFLAAEFMRPFQTKSELFLPFFRLFCKGFENVPAGSLPDDDFDLAYTARMSESAWKNAKAEILASWELGADQRWRHPMLTEVVATALAQKRRPEKARQALAEKRAAAAALREEEDRRMSGHALDDFDDDAQFSRPH